MPNIYVQDNKGIFPVDLSRSKTTEIPCHDTLLEECFKYYLAQILNLKFDDNLLASKKIPWQPIKFCVNNNPSNNNRISDCGAIQPT